MREKEEKLRNLIRIWKRKLEFKPIESINLGQSFLKIQRYISKQFISLSLSFSYKKIIYFCSLSDRVFRTVREAREEFYDDINLKFSSFLLKLRMIQRADRDSGILHKESKPDWSDGWAECFNVPEMCSGLSWVSRYVGHYSQDCLQSNVIVWSGICTQILTRLRFTEAPRPPVCNGESSLPCGTTLIRLNTRTNVDAGFSGVPCSAIQFSVIQCKHRLDISRNTTSLPRFCTVFLFTNLANYYLTDAFNVPCMKISNWDLFSIFQQQCVFN